MLKTRVTVVVTLEVEANNPGTLTDHKARMAATEAVENAVRYAEDNGFSHGLEDDVCMFVKGVRQGTRYIKVEWHPEFEGEGCGELFLERIGDEANTALIPVGCDIERTFEEETSHDAWCITSYSEDEHYDSDGNLLTGEQDEAYNALGYDLRNGLSVAQAKWELATSHEKFLEAISAATTRGLDGSLYGEVGLYSQHEAQHTGWIRRWRTEQGV